MINKEIYSKALDLRERLNKDFDGFTHELVICYVLTEAIDKIKNQLSKSYEIKSEDGFILDADQTLDRLREMTSDLNKK